MTAVAIACTAVPLFGEDLSGLDRGHRLMIENGLQLMALVDRDLNSTSNWLNSNFTTLQFSDHHSSSDSFGTPQYGTLLAQDLVQMDNPQWGRLTAPPETNSSTLQDIVPDLVDPFISDLTMLQYLDVLSISQQSEIDDAAAVLLDWRQQYPNAIGYANPFSSTVSIPSLQNFLAQAQPDMLFVRRAEFNGSTAIAGPSNERGTLYFHMQRTRTLAMLGHDASGTTPIPYGMYTQNTAIPGSAYDASGSETNLQYFAAFAFGFKSLSAFTYARPQNIDGLQHSMFEAANTIASTDNGQPYDTDPKQMYFDVAEANRQALNLAPTLVRLLSTDVRVDRGNQQNGLINVKASNVDDWDAAADPFITSISAVNNGPLNNGNRGDVVIGYFEPLLNGFAGDNDLYFMVVNGLTSLSDSNALLDGSAANTEQTITLQFDFNATGINSLQRLNRDTGVVEVIDDVSEGWTSLGGSQYKLDLTLGGGLGDLFKFNTGNAFVGFNPLGDMNGNGLIDMGDVPLFVQALVNRADYDAIGFGVDADIIGDVNESGTFDLGDLADFSALFTSNVASAASVPEPSALMLVSLMLIGLAIGGRHRPRLIGVRQRSDR